MMMMMITVAQAFMGMAGIICLALSPFTESEATWPHRGNCFGKEPGKYGAATAVVRSSMRVFQVEFALGILPYKSFLRCK